MPELMRIASALTFTLFVASASAAQSPPSVQDPTPPRQDAVEGPADPQPEPTTTERRQTGVKVLSQREKQALAQACLDAGGTGRACQQLGR